MTYAYQQERVRTEVSGDDDDVRQRSERTGAGGAAKVVAARENVIVRVRSTNFDESRNADAAQTHLSINLLE